MYITLTLAQIKIIMQFNYYYIPLPVGYTAPSNWIGYSTYSSARTPYITINNNLSDCLGLTQGQHPPAASLPELSNYSLLSNKKSPIATYVNSIIIYSSLVNNNVVSPPAQTHWRLRR